MQHHRILKTFHKGDVRVVLVAVTAGPDTVYQMRLEKLVWEEEDVISSATILFADDYGELAELAACLGLAAFDASGWARAKAFESEEESSGARSTTALTKK